MTKLNSRYMKKKRRFGLFFLQVVVSVCLLAYLFWRTSDDQGPSTLLSSFPEWDFWTIFWIVAAFALTMLSFVAATWRWSQMVHAIGLKEDFRRLLSHFMAGQFTSNFLPTSIGGDIVRIARLRKDVQDAPRSFTSVVFERLSGWIALPILILVGFAIDSGVRSLGARSQVAFILALVTLAGLAAIVFVVGHEAVGRVLRRRKGGLRYIHALHTGLEGLKRSRSDAWGLITAALAYQLVLVLAARCAIEALGIEGVSTTAVMVFLPAVLIAQVLPISIGGFGVREGLFVFFLSSLGVSDSEATLFGLFLGILTLLSSLVGVIPLVFGGKKRAEAAILQDLAEGEAALSEVASQDGSEDDSEDEDSSEDASQDRAEVQQAGQE